MEPEIIAATIEAVGSVLGATIVGIVAGSLGRGYLSRRDLQDRESQWRQHAIELAKLDMERKLASRSAGRDFPLRPSILDFLANYRDLQELGGRSPASLYSLIEKVRVTKVDDAPS